LIDQVVNYVIPIFETIHPGAIAVFAFDNSTNHDAMPKDGLNVTKILEVNSHECIQHILDQTIHYNQ